MAKGKRCPCCGRTMYAQDEQYQEKGTWVVYVCRNGACPKCKRNGKPAQCTHKEKVFEGK